jgi:Homeodomain-like domain
LQTLRPTIARWKTRFVEDRMAGLEPQRKGSSPRTITPLVLARVLGQTQRKPEDGSTHWFCRKMAVAMGVSKPTVQRIWATARIQPHRLERYMASDASAHSNTRAEVKGCW